MAKSASDRIERIRSLLARHDSTVLEEGASAREEEDLLTNRLDVLDSAIDLLREFVDQAAEPADEDAIVKQVWDATPAHISGHGVLLQADDLMSMIRSAVRAGEQSALERWEPDERAPEPEITIDLQDTRILFDENGLTIEFDDRMLLLEATRTDLMLALDAAEDTFTPYDAVVAEARHRMNERIDAAVAKVRERGTD